jgi:hypothetical protein
MATARIVSTEYRVAFPRHLIEGNSLARACR